MKPGTLRSAGDAPPVAAKPLDERVRFHRTMLCTGCEWNFNWVCQHSGCKPCAQKASGGLVGKISRPHETCPAGKW